MLVREIIEGTAAAVVVCVGAVEVGIIAREAEWDGVGLKGSAVEYRRGDEEIGRVLQRGPGSKS